jgi:hypothetical protein
MPFSQVLSRAKKFGACYAKQNDPFPFIDEENNV